MGAELRDHRRPPPGLACVQADVQRTVDARSTTIGVQPTCDATSTGWTRPRKQTTVQEPWGATKDALDLERCAVRSFRETEPKSWLGTPMGWRNCADFVENAREFIACARSATPATAFAVTVGDAPVGAIGVMLRDDVERCSAEVGYWLGEPQWGRGIASCALVGFTRFAFVAYEVAPLCGPLRIEHRFLSRAREGRLRARRPHAPECHQGRRGAGPAALCRPTRG